MKGMAMKNTVGLMLVAALACAAACPARAASVTLTSSSGDLTLSQALADAGATVADLTGNMYDDIVVAGNGNILFDTDISAYTGTIHISSGATVKVTALGGCGATSGKVYVADGGALIPDATGFAANAFTMPKDEIHLAGVGPDGKGALVAVADANQRLGIWGNSFVLDGDALIANRVARSYVLDFPKQSPSTSVINLDMNGHTLTFAPRTCYIPVRMVVANPGHIVVTNDSLSMNNGVRLNGTAANTFTFRNGGYNHFFQMDGAGIAPWTLVYDSSGKMLFEQLGGRWDGPVRLLKPFKLEARTMNGNNLFNPKVELYGPISGEEGIVINSDVPTRGAGHLYLYSTNSFKGGVVLNENTYLHVMTNGAVPSAGAPILMTNAFLDVQADFCVLPSVDCFCSDAGAITSSDALSGRIAGTLTKRGGGTLDCTWSSKKDGIDLKAGTLKLASDADAWYAGVYEGDRSLGWSTSAQTSEWGSPLYYSTTSLRDDVQKSMRWVMSASTFPKGGCTVYEGWIYCSPSEAGKWRFASNVISLGRLFIDGNEIINKQGLNQVCFGNATMTSGWHRVMFRMGRTGGSGGPNTSLNGAYEYNSTAISMDAEMLAAWQASGLGLSICKDSAKADAKTTNLADFAAFPSDPGDGSVLRFVQPGSAEEADLAVAFTNRQLVGFFAAATNTVLDLCGMPFSVGCVTGFPTVVHTDIPAWLAGSTPNLTVTNGWTASAEDLASGAAFTVTGGALTFAEGATLTVPDSRALPDTRGGNLAVATATGGIAGLPELVFAEGDRRGILRKSDDGKSLLLTVASGMMVIFR